jgi:ABC-type oligopeptide transport system substrate-binding subunit
LSKPGRSRTAQAGRTAVLYTCDLYPCAQLAQIVKTDLAAIGLRVVVKSFPILTMFARIARPGEPFDIAPFGWGAAYPDPANMLAPMLDDSSLYPTFDDPAYQHRLAKVGRLTGPGRYLAYGQFDIDLARNGAPLIAYGIPSGSDFFSTRIGCQTYSLYGIDLAALCIRPPP